MKAIIFVLAIILLQINAQTCTAQGEVPNWKDKVCIKPKYIEGCFSYANPNRCGKCQFLYERNSDGKCALKPSEDVKQCCQRKVGGKCVQCKSGLFLSQSGKCQELNIDGCIEKDFQNGNCKVCASQFNLLSGICQRAVTNCVQYTNSEKTECKTCALDYSLISNSCIKNTILGCQTQDNGKCKKCYQPFDLVDSGKCIIQNCKTYNDFGCVACECAFYITPNNVCKSMREGCIRYLRGKCIDCLPSWRLKGNDCILPGCQHNQIQNGLCKKCKSGYDLTASGRCEISNCALQGDDFCYECKEGYIQKLGKCVNETKNIRVSTTS